MRSLIIYLYLDTYEVHMSHTFILLKMRKIGSLDQELWTKEWSKHVLSSFLAEYLGKHK